jgi:hypothetical protein
MAVVYCSTVRVLAKSDSVSNSKLHGVLFLCSLWFSAKLIRRKMLKWSV